MMREFDALILGGGAAGLMCAIEAGKRGLRVGVIEHQDRLGKKILISGGGRCNFTNVYCEPENFLSANPHFAKSALSRYSPQHFIELLERHNVLYHEKTLGQLFCDRSAQDILRMLETECRGAGVSIFLNIEIKSVERGKDFIVHSVDDEFRAEALVVATGGLSIPKIGASSLGYEVATQFGLAVRDTRPALVPFTFSAEDLSRYSDLSGIPSDVIVSSAGRQFREKMLITHRGLSGPSILQISSYWKQGQMVAIDLAPDNRVTALFQDPKAPRTNAALREEFRKFLPRRFSDRWLEFHAPASWTNRALEDFEKQVHAWPIFPSGTEGYEKAEVTAGGVDTQELSAQTMESRKVAGLFFVGEVIDVTGQLGGYNFQWAWASGAAAGRAL